MSTKVIIFYVLVGAVVLGKVSTTLYERSSTAHHGHQVATLQRDKSVLTDQKLVLTQQLAQQTALTDINQNLAETDFTAITSPIIISTQQLASSSL